MGGYNNPVLAGVVEAVRREDPRPLVSALSIGTGSVVLPEAGDPCDKYHPGLVLPRRGECALTYLETAATCILDDPPDAASYVTHVMLGGREPTGPRDVVRDGPIVRMNPLVQPIRTSNACWDLPANLSAPDFAALTKLELDAVTDDEVALIEKLADQWLVGNATTPRAVRNQPIRANRWLEVEIGQGTFGEARGSAAALGLL
jgi:hypothetical protein